MKDIIFCIKNFPGFIISVLLPYTLTGVLTVLFLHWIGILK